jgi:hypothetical protein
VIVCITWALSCASIWANDGAERWWGIAKSMPPELGADVLLRVASAPGAILADTNRERVLAGAFELANRAKESYARAGRMELGESRARYVALSAGIGLNRLTLQCRVIRAVLPAAPGAARHLLEQVELPALPPASCGDPLIADVSEYYDTVRLVLAHPGAGSGRVAFLSQLLEHIHSPVQLAPAARLLAQSAVDAAGLKRLVETYANGLRRIRGADPAFRYAVVNQHLVSEVEALGRKCRTDWDLSGELLSALREFVMAHLSGPACHYSFLPEARREIQAAVVEPYNSRLRLPGELTREGVPALEVDEIWPSDADNTRPEVRAFWQDSEAQSLWARVAERDADGGSGELRISPTEMADQVSAWQRPVEMAEEEFFHQKLLLYQRLARTVPTGTLRRDVVGGLVGFLAGSPMEGRAPAEWLWHVIALMRDDVLREDVLRAMGEAADLILRAYAELELRIPGAKLLAGGPSR